LLLEDRDLDERLFDDFFRAGAPLRALAFFRVAGFFFATADCFFFFFFTPPSTPGRLRLWSPCSRGASNLEKESPNSVHVGIGARSHRVRRAPI
jgi:hypothetical protein